MKERMFAEGKLSSGLCRMWDLLRELTARKDEGRGGNESYLYLGSMERSHL